MVPEDLSDDLKRFMRLILERGGTECSGTCHHRKPGEVHCHGLARDLRISSSGVKERILTLARMGLVTRERIERPGTYAIIRFTVSAEGKRLLADTGECPET
jgi:hypothetical protein